MSSRAMKRNTQGGKAFKSKAKGGTHYSTKAAQDGAQEMLDLIMARQDNFAGLKPEERLAAERALLEIQVGKVVRKFGNGRFEVQCQDNKLRNCAVRGVMRRKGKCFIDLDCFVVVSLTEALEELDSSDDEGNFGGGKARAGAEFRSGADMGYIAGLFDAHTTEQLRKTRLCPRLFKVQDEQGNLVDDLFDRSGAEGGDLGDGETKDKKEKKGKKVAGADDDVKLEDL